MRTVFMGTAKIAAVILETLLNAGEEVIGVVTQPDRPKGRGKELAYPEVKSVALRNKIPVWQPERVKEEGFLSNLQALNPEIIIVAAFGQILPVSILEMPKHGCINVHASLLPKYRGAAPIQWAVINGEKKSGITIIHMDKGIDTGDMIFKAEVELAPKETAGSLYDKLAKLGGEALLKAIAQIKAGTDYREKQDDSLSCYAKMLDKNMGELDFSQPAEYLERLIRGLNPWPSAYTFVEGKTLKIWDADVISDQNFEEWSASEMGTIIDAGKDRILIKTGKGILAVNELQLEGKKRLTAKEFLRGFSITPGVKLGRRV